MGRTLSLISDNEDVVLYMFGWCALGGERERASGSGEREICTKLDIVCRNSLAA